MNYGSVIAVGAWSAFGVWLASQMVGRAAWLAGRARRAWEDRDRRRHIARMRAREAEENRLRREARQMMEIHVWAEELREEIEQAAAEAAEIAEWGEIVHQVEEIRNLPETSPAAW